MSEFPVRVAFAAAIFFAMAACQSSGTQTASLPSGSAEIQFQQSGLIAPPRQVDDVLALIARHIPQARASRQAVLAELSAPLDQELTGRRKAAALLRRARMAHQAGDSDAELSLYSDALAASDAAKSAGFMSFLTRFELGRAEVLGGSLSRGLARMRDAPRFISRDADDDTTASYAPIPLISYLAVLSGELGDLPSATTARNEVERRYARESNDFGHWPPDGVSIMKANRGAAQAAVAKLTGDVELAEELYRDAIERFSVYRRFPVKNYFDYDISILHLYHQTLQLELADIYRLQGRHAEAEALSRKALVEALETHGALSAHTAEVIRRLARIMLHQGRPDDAKDLAAATVSVLAQAGVPKTSGAYGRALATLADSHTAIGAWREAGKRYTEAGFALENDPTGLRVYVNENVEFGIAALKTGDAARARDVFQAAADRQAGALGKDAIQVQELRGLSAVARLALGEPADHALETAAQALLADSGSGAAEDAAPLAQRAWRRRIVLETYIERLWRDGSSEAHRTAFEAATALTTGSVERSVAYSGARANARSPEIAELLRQEQDTSLKLTAAIQQLSAALVGDQDPAPLRASVTSLRSHRDALRTNLASQFPELAELVSPKPVTTSEAGKFIGPDEALIATYFALDGLYSWAVAPDGATHMHRATLATDEAVAIIDELRAALDPNPQTLGDIPRFDIAQGHRLYAELLAPHAAIWQGRKRLIVAAHGPLGFLPISILPTRPDLPDAPSDAEPFAEYRAVAWLARSHAVSMIPSVGTLRLLRGGRAGPVGAGLVGFGDPVFSPTQVAATPTATTTRGIRLRNLPSGTFRDATTATIEKLPPLPDTADELRQIAAALGVDAATSLFLRERASESAAKKQDYSSAGTLAFATHGLLPGDLNGLSQPALALSGPAVTRDGEDGLLTSGEILGLRLNADWVVLSACNTGAGDGKGAEAVSGLGRAFFYAGARSLLVSNWPVHSQSARDLTTAMFAAYRAAGSADKAGALQSAMLSVIDGPGFVDDAGQTYFSYAHPIFWAPFSLVGAP